MKRLPLWVLNDRNPAFYDSESATAIEQTAKVYGAMNQLIEETNAFIESFNGAVERVEKDFEDEYNLFKQSINTQIYDFTHTVELEIQKHKQDTDKAIAEYYTQLEADFNAYKTVLNGILEANTNELNTKMKQMQTQIDEAEAYMKNNIESTTREIINVGIENGSFKIGYVYDEANEELNMVIQKPPLDITHVTGEIDNLAGNFQLDGWLEEGKTYSITYDSMEFDEKAYITISGQPADVEMIAQDMNVFGLYGYNTFYPEGDALKYLYVFNSPWTPNKICVYGYIVKDGGMWGSSIYMGDTITIKEVG